jgi:N-acetylmuramoyl-L-alanine amidase
MPIIYLSPSTQEYNPYVGGGNEEYYMNLIADAMIPYLQANGIQYVRNTPDMTAAQNIAQSNAGNFDLHLALHSNATADASGMTRGTDVYYYPYSARSQRFADLVAANMKLIYPIPELVRTVPTTTLGEVARTRAPAVLVEIAYHDNPEDAEWIRSNIGPIAEALSRALAEYFGIPFAQPLVPAQGTVRTQGGTLNVRSLPDPASSVIMSLQNGSKVTVIGEINDWYVISLGAGDIGYVNKNFILL